MKKFKIVALVTMMLLSLSIGTVQAGTFANGANAGVVLATESFGTGSAGLHFPTTAIAEANYVFAAAPGIGAHIMITYTLGNATFATALSNNSLTFLTAGADISTILMTGGTAGSSTATFRCDVSTADMVAGDAVRLLYNIHILSAATPTLGITLIESGDNVDTSGSLNVYTVLTGSAETVASTPAVVATKIDVAADRLEFTGGATTTDVVIGSLTLADTNATFQPDIVSAWTFALLGAGGFGATTPTDIDFTITGNFAASVGATVACATGGVYIAPVAGANVCPTTLTATTATFNLTGARLALGDFTGANIIRMEVDGVTAIEETTPSVAGTVNFTNTDVKYLNDTFSGSLFALTNNGSTRYLYNIPSPGSDTLKGYVHIINTSTLDARIRGTLTLADGTPYTGTLITLLPAGQRQVLTSDQIATALGAPVTWTGRARLIVVGEMASMEVQGVVMNTVGGVTTSTNFSTVAP